MSTVPPSTDENSIGLTCADYAVGKGLSAEFLRQLGLSDFFYIGKPAVRMPYRQADGRELSVRFRLAMDGPRRFGWRKGDKAVPYGLERLGDARAAGFVILCEGESDAQTLWQHNLPALGLPGSATWREDRDATALDEIATIFVVREPGDGGDKLVASLASSSVLPRVKVVTLAPHKDPSELYLANPSGFVSAMHGAMAAAVPLAQIVDGARAESAAKDLVVCRDLASSPNILDKFADSLRVSGVVGEDRNAKILFLALTSRLLPKPVNVAVKGPSSGGKSFIVGRVLDHFPDEAFVFRTTFSEHALIYSDEPYRHRHLVIAEATGADGDKQEYLVRTLLSEGRIEYETVEKIGGVMTARRITKEGPTGLIVTTTRTSLHPENETRLISLTVTDTQTQTCAVIQAIAEERSANDRAGTIWHAFQRWLAAGETRVIVPFAPIMGKLVNPAATRVRRDFTTLLSLIKSHALLHRQSREHDAEGRVIATIGDYVIVHDLVADLFAHGVAKTVKPTVRETAEAVRSLSVDGPVTNQAVAKRLGIDEAASSRRCREAIALGYVVNEEERKGRPAKYVSGGAMPVDEAVLPSAEKLVAAISQGEGGTVPLAQEVNRSIALGLRSRATNGCAIDRLLEGKGTPLSPLPIARVVEEFL